MNGVEKEGGGHGVLLGMLIVQAIAIGLQLLSKVILGQGTFVFALLTYRHTVATLFVAPLAFFRERESLKKLNAGVVVRLFFVALFGIPMALGLFYYGLRDTTATYATNFLNLIPLATFILSLIFRVEKLRMNHKDGRIKIIGAMLCLVGALTTTFYKGKTFYLRADHLVSNQVNENWARGTIFLTFSCLSYGLWFVTQAMVWKDFPYKFSITTITCIMATFQSTAIGLCIDRTEASWKLGWNLQLITIIYSRALASAATLCLVYWATAKRGPTYPSMFNPLSLGFVALTEAIFLGASISVGSVIGMAVLIVGLYLFLWGKSMEIKDEAG